MSKNNINIFLIRLLDRFIYLIGFSYKIAVLLIFSVIILNVFSAGNTIQGAPSTPEALSQESNTSLQDTEEARDRRWAARETPAARAEVIEQFRNFLNLGNDEKNLVSGLNARLEMKPIIDFLKKNNPEEALKAFESYYYKKLQHPLYYGFTSEDVSPYSRGVAGYGRFPGPAWTPAVPVEPSKTPQEIIKTAELMLQGKAAVGPKGAIVDLGPPGKLNWYYPLAYGQVQDPLKPFIRPHELVASGMILIPLAQAYSLTHDERYLRAWMDYMDDWSLNSNYSNTIHPCFIPQIVNSIFANEDVVMIQTLAALSAALPWEKHPLPTRVFAQIIPRLFGSQPLLGLVYLRSNCHNWTPGAAPMLTSILGDEFISAPLLFREAKRRNVEDNAVTQNLRDGTENQQDPWYNENYLNTISTLRMMDAQERAPSFRMLPWIKEAQKNGRWLDEIHEHLKEHVSYMLRLKTPQDEWPIPFRGGDKRSAPTTARIDSPEAYADPVNQLILSALSGDSTARPPYDSEWFPYGGYSIIRDGWGPHDGYGAMFTSPQPGAYGGYRSRSNNNSFGVATDGQDLLVDDSIGHYMYPSSPIRVDGLNQFFHAKDGVYKVLPPAAHKSYMQRAWTEPAPWRWLTSKNFDVTEGIYDGPYASDKVPQPAKGTYPPEESQRLTLGTDQGIRGVIHQRLVQYVRAAKLWIITDRMISKEPHTFDQVWRFPLRSPSNNVPTFVEKDFVINDKTQTISTESQEKVIREKIPSPKANITLYQFSSVPLSYTNKIVPKDEANHYMPYGRNEITAQWKSTGPSQVITLIQPRPNGETRISSVTPLKDGDHVVGFDAKGSNGVAVSYLSADQGSAMLKIGTVTANAESLLLSGDKGVVLGCKELQINGKTVPLTVEDAEFSLPFNSASVIPIYRPIDPVVIGPDRNVFTDSIETTMTSRTPGVKIHYTLDGSDPTPSSPLYTAPVKLTGYTVVKARAYRPGVTNNPIENSGTLATAISSALFTQKTLLSPHPKAKVTGAGLHFSYWQDDWKKLWYFTDQLKPAVSSTVTNLFDLSKIPADNPALGSNPAPRQKYYAVQYDGYLDIPKDGVYTFHAPREFVYPDMQSGYELRLFVGDKYGDALYADRIQGINEWYPSTRLHAFGNWSIALQKGLHPFKLFFLDYRTDAAQKLNLPHLRPYIWTGSTPEILVSGPGFEKQPIPASWFKY